MKKIVMMMVLFFGNSACFAQTNYEQDKQSREPSHQTQGQMQYSDTQIEKNTKSITLLTVAIGFLVSFISALLLYIKKQHSKVIDMSGKFIEATVKMNSTQEKLSCSIDNSAEKLSGAVDRSTAMTNELHKYIIQTSTK